MVEIALNPPQSPFTKGKWKGDLGEIRPPQGRGSEVKNN